MAERSLHPGRTSPESSAATPVDPGSQALADALHSSFAIVRFLMLVLVLVFFASSFFVIGPQERGLILRLGKPVGEGEAALLGPGLHWSFPYPIDEVVRIRITEVQTLRSTIGWYALTPEQELAGTEPPVDPRTPLIPGVDGYLLSADGNIIHSRATLRYRIKDPLRCVFGFGHGTNAAFDLAGVSNAVLETLNQALLHAAARFTVDDILSRNVLGFQEEVLRRFTSLAEQRNLGIAIEQLQVESRPPRQLKQAFDNVVQAAVRRSQLLNDALGYANQTTNRAASEAAALVSRAQADRTRYLETLAAEARRFEGLLAQFERNPDLYMQQRVAETMARLLTNVQDKFFIPERADGKTRELRLLLNREPPKPQTTSPAR
ncbi:MAG: protease modulator HflK [Verrucomicrobiota bacterium]|nr:protease modulator HflK [Limisphaera sp.]MDW8382788.1 protease modulator HflK [Verrucomicrobiota bacterium]